MKFPAYQIEPAGDGCIKISVKSIDETELIYDDPEAQTIINARNLLSEQEKNATIFQEPHPMIWGENIHIHGRFIVDELCKVYLLIHPDVDNRDDIEQLARRLLNNEIEVPEVNDISHICFGGDCTLSTWEEIEQLAYWIKSRGPY